MIKPVSSQRRKGAEKTSPKQPEFSAVKNVAGARSTDSAWWTGAQFAALVPGFDEEKLRRLANEKVAGSLNPATGAPWIPKPRAARFEFTPTLKGVIAYLLHQLEHADTLPKQCSGMNVVEGIFKATARALRQAIEKDPRGQGVPSTKGVL